MTHTMQTVDTRSAILIVDDEPTNLQILRLVPQDLYRLHFAKNGKRALDAQLTTLAYGFSEAAAEQLLNASPPTNGP